MNIGLSTDITPSDSKLLEQLYIGSFPAEERRPWQSIVSPVNPHGPKLYAIIANGKIAGLATLWLFDDFAYIEHLAVSPEVRGSGIGGNVIKKLRQLAGKREIVVEIEPPTATQPDTIRRRNFYISHGFEVIDTNYVQPPYSPELNEVPMHLMATAPMAPHKTGRTLHTEVYGRV